MRTDVAAPSSTVARARAITATLYATSVTPRDMINGNEGAGTSYDGQIVSGTLTHDGATLRLALARNATLPRPNQCIRFYDGSTTLFQGVIESVNRHEMRGTDYSFDVVVRRRDASPLWREVRRVSGVYPVGVDLGMLARDVAGDLLESDELVRVGGLGVTLAHDQAQLADLPALDMLRAIMFPARCEPAFDALGRLYPLSRDCSRPSSVVLEDWSEDGASYASAPLTAVRVRYVDPYLVVVEQADQALAADVTLTCGFFGGAKTDVWWSADHSRRAKNVYLNVKQSVNANQSILGVVENLIAQSEYLEVNDQRLGPLESGANVGVSTLATSSLGGKIVVEATSLTSKFFETFFSSVIDFDFDWSLFDPIASLAAPVANIASQVVLLGHRLSSVGVGIYEVRGQPVDWVHAVNEVEAYDVDAPAWAGKIEVLESSLIPNEECARGVAASELVYRAKAANGARLTVLDDPRLEPGDIVELSDARRFYVSGYSRDLARHSLALLHLEGFFL